MTDRRLTPANARVAALHLKGQVTAEHFTEGTPATVTVAVIDLCTGPNQNRERQLKLGADVTVFEDGGGWSFVQAVADGYVGYVQSAALGPRTTATHFVCSPATHAYLAADMKSQNVMQLPFGTRLTVTAEQPKFFETAQGFIPEKHLRSLELPFDDPVAVAQMHLGVPYLWGGNSTRGIDCSGLVQASLQACGVPCPGDSDMQQGDTGKVLAKDAGLQRGDLIFWEGHVGIMVDSEVMIHANAYHMAVAYEPIKDAILRIRAQGDGEVTSRKRLT